MNAIERRAHGSSHELAGLLAFLQSFDKDKDASNGIQLDEGLHAIVSDEVDLDEEAWTSALQEHREEIDEEFRTSAESPMAGVQYLKSEPAERGFHFRSLKAALATPSIGLILLALLVCVFSFANFETTLSLLIKGDGQIVDSPFKMTFRDVCLTYAFIGFTLAIVQGGLVRRMAGRISA